MAMTELEREIAASIVEALALELPVDEFDPEAPLYGEPLWPRFDGRCWRSPSSLSALMAWNWLGRCKGRAMYFGHFGRLADSVADIAPVAAPLTNTHVDARGHGTSTGAHRCGGGMRCLSVPGVLGAQWRHPWLGLLLTLTALFS